MGERTIGDHASSVDHHGAINHVTSLLPSFVVFIHRSLIGCKQHSSNQANHPTTVIMLCEVHQTGNLLLTWAVLSGFGLLLIMTMSGYLFWKLYMNPTYDTWQKKSNPNFPRPEMVRAEIIQMLKGMGTATLCPAISLWLTNHGMSKAYCGVGEMGWAYLIVSFFVCWIAVDFWEFFYHRLGHTTTRGWEQHKPHHLFYNPSPFAVIADEYIDQFVRAFPLILFPMLVPINMDMMFFQFGAFFYAYGVYLHSGYELDWPNAHHPWINTAFQHYWHHAVSIRNKPYHTGFFFKLWDQLFDSEYKGECQCAKCCREAGKRTAEQFAMIEKPNYSPLFQLSFWKAAFTWQPPTPDSWNDTNGKATNGSKGDHKDD